MTKRKPLEWVNDEGGAVLGLPCCSECFEMLSSPGMVEAAASVGIEHGKSTGLMLKEYIDAYHARRHEDAA